MRLNILVKWLCVCLVLLSYGSFAESNAQKGGSAPVERKVKKVVQRYHGPKERRRKPVPPVRADSAKTAICEVTVDAIVNSVESVEMNKATTSILVGGKETLSVVIVPAKALNKAVPWSRVLSDYYFNYSVAPWDQEKSSLSIGSFAVTVSGQVAAAGDLSSGRYATLGVGDPCTYYLGFPVRCVASV